MDVLVSVTSMNFPSKNNAKKIFLFLVILFIWSRVWRLPHTLEFFSDIGRDHFVLLGAVQKVKPPLLGPSNSALPLNQSPIYYYLNFPVFLLSGFSPYTTFVTLLILFVSVFWIGYRWYREKIFPIILLSTVHPQFLSQMRYPWNPTFTVPFLLLALFTLNRNWAQKRYIWIFSLCMAIAVGCSYSVLPTVIVLVIYVVWKKNQSILSILFPLASSFFLVFLPLLLVELRTDFLLTKRMGIELTSIGAGVSYWQKIRELSSYVLGVDPVATWPIFCVLGIIALACIARPRPRLLWVLISSLILTLLAPFRMGPHYIFGVTTVLFVVIATLPKKIRFLLFVCLLIIWVPQLSAQLTYVPRRTVRQLEACAKDICQKEKSPLYVSVQAWHSYHYAPDWMFFFAKSGCSVADVTQSPGYARRMAVVVDQSSYEHGKTAYNELTLFGSSSVDTTYSCEGDISVVMIEQ